MTTPRQEPRVVQGITTFKPHAISGMIPSLADQAPEAIADLDHQIGALNLTRDETGSPARWLHCTHLIDRLLEERLDWMTLRDARAA